MTTDAPINNLHYGFRDISEFYQISLWSGDAILMDVESWIDSLICDSNIVLPWLVDLSTCSTKAVEDVISDLDEVPGESQGSLPLKMYLGRLCNRLRSGCVSGHAVCKKVWLVFQGETPPDRLLMLRRKQDFALDYQRPGFIREEEDVKKYYERILDEFVTYDIHLGAGSSHTERVRSGVITSRQSTFGKEASESTNSLAVRQTGDE